LGFSIIQIISVYFPPQYAALVGEDPLEDDEEEYNDEGEQFWIFLALDDQDCLPPREGAVDSMLCLNVVIACLA
jgi:hypothetical protein